MQHRASTLYRQILAHGHAGVERFYRELQARGIRPTPNFITHDYNLYAPNPVILDAEIVRSMTHDANVFCRYLRERYTTPEALLELVPADIREHYFSRDVLERLLSDHQNAHPLVCLDAFLEQTPDGLQPAYLEWQTVGTYITMGLDFMQAAATAWSEIAHASSLTGDPAMSFNELCQLLRTLYLDGIEDDPQQGVIVDFRPEIAPTRREFKAIHDLTGGMAVLDLRELRWHGGCFCYQRNGRLIPIRRVFSRLVYSDLKQFEREATQDQIKLVRRFYQEAEQFSWISHLLHFFYGSKADLPHFWQANLSPHLPECRVVDADVVHEMGERFGDQPLLGFVQKPLNAQSGRDVIRYPTCQQLVNGAILQREIMPVACHQTLHGARTPEVRIMAIPNRAGELITGLVYNRIKAPEAFLSNAGTLARENIAGTGEGFAVVV